MQLSHLLIECDRWHKIFNDFVSAIVVLSSMLTEGSRNILSYGEHHLLFTNLQNTLLTQMSH